MFRPALQGFLVFVVLGGVTLFFIQYFFQDQTLLTPNECKHTENICRSQEMAAKCRALTFCEIHWRKTGLSNKTINQKQLRIGVYYETLCKDSIKFIKEQLYPTFKKLYETGIFKLELIPSGNVQRTKKAGHWEFSCQHAEEECIGNRIQACTIDTYPNVTMWMSFVYCMEKQDGMVEYAKGCAKQEGIDYELIENCSNGPVGKKLQLKMALKTEALKPKHTFIPWITVNGKSTGLQKKALDDLTGLICGMYTGKKPAACSQM